MSLYYMLRFACFYYLIVRHCTPTLSDDDVVLSLYSANSNNNYYSYEGVFHLTLLHNTPLSQMDLFGIIEA